MRVPLVGLQRSRDGSASYPGAPESLKRGWILPVLASCLLSQAAFAQDPEITQADLPPAVAEGGGLSFFAEAEGGSGDCSLQLDIKPAGADDSGFIFIASVSGGPGKTLSGSTNLINPPFSPGAYQARFLYDCDGSPGLSDEVRLALSIVEDGILFFNEISFPDQICLAGRVDFSAAADGGGGPCSLRLDVKQAGADDGSANFIASISGADPPLQLVGGTTLPAVTYPVGDYEYFFTYACESGTNSPVIERGALAIVQCLEEPAVITACKQDTEGTPLPGWTIELDGPEQRSDVTGVDGCVTFEVILTGDYSVSEVQRAGWTAVAPAGNSFPVTPESGETYGPYNFVNFEWSTVTACKVDIFGNPLAGWTINLLDGSGTEIDDDETGETDGCVTFTLQEAGTYRLSEDLRTYWEQVEPLTGYFEFQVTSGSSQGFLFRNSLHVPVPVLGKTGMVLLSLLLLLMTGIVARKRLGPSSQN